MKQRQISLDPMPSRISRPVRSRQRSQTLAGRASPALAQERTLEKSASAPLSMAASMRAYSVGMPKKSVGRRRRTWSKTVSGVASK
jgi:hypothetical protein